MKTLFLSLPTLLLLISCTSAPKKYCTDLSHLDKAAPSLNEQKEYDLLNKTCQEHHETTVDRADFSKHYEVGRKNSLKAICTCEKGFQDQVRPRSPGSEGTKADRLKFAKTCGEVQQEKQYTAGISLGEAALKKFKPNHLAGPTELTENDAVIACKTLK